MTDREGGDGHTTVLREGLTTELRVDSSDPKPIADSASLLDVSALVPGKRYEQIRQLGEGGMGEVRLCRDRVIGREVAMKVMLDAQASREDMKARFVREARVQGQLEHPAIVPVYDFGAGDDDKVFFTMRRVKGVTLEEILELLRHGDAEAGRTYGWRKLLGAFVRVCQAVHYAHERGVIHRDLKPANIMLGRHGEVYVLDWGLAKMNATPDTPTSEPGVDVDDSGPFASSILGTPAYMAPEQIRGDDLDGRADVYALGAILFEILTLEPLHGGGTVASILQRALKGVEARPSVRAPARNVPPEIEVACVRATMLDREKRWSSPSLVADAIERFLDGDRDLELRRALAADHLARARESGTKALGGSGSLGDRAAALREVGHAIALAPEDVEARALLVRLLTHPPNEAPPEVVTAMDRAQAEAMKRMLPRGAGLCLATIVLLFVMHVALGVRDWTQVILSDGFWVVVAVLCLVMGRLKDPRPFTPVFPFLTAIAISLGSIIHGPFLVLPAGALLVAMALGLIGTTRRRRILSSITSMAALVIPIALAWRGMHPIAHVFEGDRALCLLANAVDFPRNGTVLALSANYLILMVAGVSFAIQYRRGLTLADEKRHVQAWQLRQLVPVDAARAMAPSNPDSSPRGARS
jgi:eukaryotic-like serine/threonine-protein kinase